MSHKLIIEGPINSLSLGNVCLNMLRAAYEMRLNVDFLPVGGQIDLAAWNLPKEFQDWIINSANHFVNVFDRNATHIKIWHVNGSHTWTGNKRILLTFHETDSATESEINIIKNTDKTFFCGEYSKNVFSDYGLTNIDSFKLGFDSNTFSNLNRKYHDDGRVSWLLAGKAEKRKHTYKLLELWAKRFGREPGQVWKPNEKHFLNVAITNPFFGTPELQNHHNQQIHNALGGKRYWNIEFKNWMQTNAEVNDLLNVTDVDITGLSGGESWNLPSFNVTCLGKWSAVLNATGHKSWATKDNCVLVNPNGKMSCIDNIFFQPNSPFNNGNFYTFKDEDAIVAFEKLATRAKTPNTAGLSLGENSRYLESFKDIVAKI